MTSVNLGSTLVRFPQTEVSVALNLASWKKSSSTS